MLRRTWEERNEHGQRGACGRRSVDDTTIVQLEATHTRLDDGKVMLPAVTIYRRGAELIDDYRVFVDLAPVYA